MEVEKVHIKEVGPREGYQFEGIGDPNRISTDNKIRLVDALSETGVECIQVTSFVHPKRVPQMADAEEISRRIVRNPSTAVVVRDLGVWRPSVTRGSRPGDLDV